MKRIFLIIGIIVSLVFAETATASFTAEEQKIIDTKVTKIQEKIDTQWEKYREFYNYTLEEEIENTTDESKKRTLEEILNKIQKKETKIETTDSLSSYNIDTERVLKTWISWQNKVRKESWIQDYTYNSILNNSALKWSQISKKRWHIDHKRNTWDEYYNYKKIGNWMQWQWVICKNISKKTFSESLWYGIFSCDDEDCTDKLVDSLKWTFNFYMSEKGKKYTPHYSAIVSPYFSTIGTGIELTKTGKTTYKYYLTTHYCTELINN